MGREEGREGGREGGRKGGREEGREGGREGNRHGKREIQSVRLLQCHTFPLASEKFGLTRPVLPHFPQNQA